MPNTSASLKQEKEVSCFAQSSMRLLLVLTITFFVAEVLIMFFLDNLPHLPDPVEAFLDAFLLIILVFPLLYYERSRFQKFNILIN